MKKIILSAVAVFTFGFASAQDTTIMTDGGKGFHDGDVFLSGTVALGSSKLGGNENTSFQVTPKLGFFVSDNFAVGPQVGYATTTTTESIVGEDVKTRTNAIQLGAFARYYGMPANDFSFFVEVGANYSSATTKPDGSDDIKTNGFNIRLAPGFNYFVSDHFAIEASIGALSYETTKADGAEDADTSFGLNLNSTNINFGLIYKF